MGHHSTWIFRIETDNYYYTSIKHRNGGYVYQIQVTGRTLKEANNRLEAIYGGEARRTLIGIK